MCGGRLAFEGRDDRAGAFVVIGAAVGEPSEPGTSGLQFLDFRFEGGDAELKKLSEAVIASQEGEIVLLEEWSRIAECFGFG